MRTYLATSGLLLTGLSTLAQGTLTFNNRNLTGPNGTTYNASISGVTLGGNATAQMFLVAGTGASQTFTPLTPVNTFRPAPNQQYLAGPVVVIVPGQRPGTTGLQFIVRVWQGSSYDTSAARDQSPIFIVGPLGGTTVSGEIFLPPDLGGPGGVGGLQPFGFPEPSIAALAILGASAFLLRRRKKV
jgi:hypothetical protein